MRGSICQTTASISRLKGSNGRATEAVLPWRACAACRMRLSQGLQPQTPQHPSGVSRQVARDSISASREKVMTTINTQQTLNGGQSQAAQQLAGNFDTFLLLFLFLFFFLVLLFL